MTWRFTLIDSPQLPPFAQFSTEAGKIAWDIDETPSVSIPGPDQSDIQADYILAAGSYSIDYDIDITNTGIGVLTIEFTKDDHSVFVATDSTGNLSGAGNFTGTLNFTLTENCEGMQIAFANFAANTKVLTINSLTLVGGRSMEISEPGGWKDHKLVMTRHPEFFSLIESIEVELLFYGEAMTFINSVDAAYGFDADLRIFVELDAEDTGDFVDYWDGILSLVSMERYKDNRATITPLANTFWTKFINRLETPVNLSSTTTLDGNPCAPLEPVTVRLTSQVIRYNGEYRWDESETYEADDFLEKFYQLDWDKVDIDDLKKFSLPRLPIFPATPMVESSKLLTAQFEAPYDGTYNFDVRIVSADLSTGPQWTANTGQVEFRIGRAGLTYNDHETFTESVEGPFDLGGGLEDSIGIFTYQGSFKLREGDQIVIYGRDVGDTSSGWDRTIFGETRWAYKTDCEAATVSAIILSGTQTIDGVSLSAGDRVLVKNQGDSSANGIYVVASGAWSRATDADTAGEYDGIAVYVTGGTTNADTAWKQTESVSSLGGSAIEWTFLTPSDERLWRYPPDADPVSSYCIITGDTTYPESEAQGYLIHDIFYGVCERILN